MNQLPQLIQSLQEIAAALAKPKTTLQLPLMENTDFFRISILGTLNRLEQYQEAVEVRNSKVTEQAYRSGFCSAVQMLISGLSEAVKAEEPKNNKGKNKEEKDGAIM